MNRKELLVISITVFITFLVWMGADIYRAYVNGQTPKDVPTAPTIKDYDLSLFEKTLKILRDKKQ